MSVIVITGTRKGIGQELSQRFLDRGWRVAGCSRSPGTIEHANYRHFELDVGDGSAVARMARAVAREWGPPDALINNAGIASMNHAVLTPTETLDSVLRTNVAGAFNFCREIAKLMRRHGGGRIVNFSSVAHPLRLEGEAAYAASKAAVESLTRILARELAEWKITVNAVGPTPVATDLIRGVPDAKMNALVRQQAIPRLGQPEDVLNVIDFFMRPESDFVTGQVIYLGGVG